MTGIMSPTYKEPTPTSPASAGFFCVPRGCDLERGYPFLVILGNLLGWGYLVLRTAFRIGGTVFCKCFRFRML